MNPHLIALDLDGTLLNKQSELSAYTRQTLHTLTQHGHHVCLVTGRPYRTSRHVYQQLGIHNPIVNFNGALCHLPHRQQWSDGYQKIIPKALALSLFRDCQAMGVHLICMEGTKHGFASQPMPDSPYTPSNDLLPLPLDATSLPEDPIAVMIFAPEEAHPSLVAMIHERYGAAVSVRTWGGIVPCLEVIAPSTNKAVGVAHLANLYQIPKQRIIAFGDEDNDYDMLHEAGHGVAMRNAIDTIKAVADDVTTFDHHQDGVAHYLCNYFGVS